MKNLSPIVLVILLALSCRAPQSTERFIRGEGPFVFTVDMSDTLASYDFDLYTRLDTRDCPPQMELLMRWTSPSDSTYRETVYLPLEGRRTPFSADVYQPYRADIRPVDPGVWTLTVAAPMPPSGFRGLGLVIRKSSVSWDTGN